MTRSRLRPARVVLTAVVPATCCTLASNALAAGSDVPDGSVQITHAQILVGVTVSGDTSDNTDFSDSGTVPLTDCGASIAPDEWYRLVITSPIEIDVSLCDPGGTFYDSKIWVQNSVGTVLACSDDGCGSTGGPSLIEGLLLTPGSFDLAIDGYGSASGAYSAELSEAVPPPPCFLAPPCSGDPEGEPCNHSIPDTINGGCNSEPDVFGTVTVDGPAICGTAWAHNGTRDTDWYRFHLAETTELDIELRAEAPTVAFFGRLQDDGSCPVAELLADENAFRNCEDPGFDGHAILVPGWYFLFVGIGVEDGNGLFDGYPCPDGTYTDNAYEVRVRRQACFLDPPCDGVDEGEPCDEYATDIYNGGCNSDAGAFGSITIDGPAICGTNWARDWERDQDWYAFTVDGAPRTIDVHLRAETSSIAFVYRMSFGGACPIMFTPPGDHAYSASCDPVPVVGRYTLDPDFYSVVVVTADESGAPLWHGFPCPDGTWRNNEYRLSLRTPLEADLSGNGYADFADILIVIQTWGPCSACPSDLNGNGYADFGDILVIIGAWGSGE
ncbi:MAG: hypothetical protein GY715_15310 [Planctomycetes bacterium]|nr:hypothetical protein [Planctomycetota bacterium]